MLRPQAEVQKDEERGGSMKGKVTSASDRRNQKQCLDTLSEMCAKHRDGHLGKRSEQKTGLNPFNRHLLSFWVHDPEVSWVQG